MKFDIIISSIMSMSHCRSILSVIIWVMCCWGKENCFCTELFPVGTDPDFLINGLPYESCGTVCEAEPVISRKE